MRRLVIFIALVLLPALVQAENVLPAIYGFDCRQGETFVRVITWRTGSATGPLVNLTGYTAKLQLRDTVSNTVIDDFTDTTGLALGGALGTITWTVTATETAALPVGSLAYDLRLTSGTSVVTYLLYGHVNVRKRVTQ
jgi:hypothetical protein